MNKTEGNIENTESLSKRIRTVSLRYGEKKAIGEEVYSGMVFFSYKKLISDAEGAAVLISELSERGSAITLYPSGGYDSATILIASSILGRSLIISSGSIGQVELTDRSGETVRIDLDRFRALTAGVLARPSPPLPLTDGGEMKLIFKSEESERCFSESAVISSSLAFSDIRHLSHRDTLISTLPESTPEGIFGGILAPLLCAATSVCCCDVRSVIRAMKLSQPTVIFCQSIVAKAIRKKLLGLCSLPLHLSESAHIEAKPLSPLKKCFGAAERALRRLLMIRIRSILGGRVRSIISLGDLPDDCIGSLAFFGIECIMILSTPRCIPAAFKYEGLRSHVWSLPFDTLADLQGVCPGGIGQITLSSPRTCEEYLPHGNGDKLRGFITKNGSIFVLRDKAS